MKSQVSRLLYALSIIALSFSCSDSVEPEKKAAPAKVDYDEIVKRARTAIALEQSYGLPNARTADADLDNIMAGGKWKLLASHNADGEAHSADNDPCYANVDWYFYPNGGYTWQVVNLSTGPWCGSTSPGDGRYSTFFQVSGWRSDKYFFTQRVFGKPRMRLVDDGRDFYGYMSFVDNKYCVLMSLANEDAILYRDPVQ